MKPAARKFIKSTLDKNFKLIQNYLNKNIYQIVEHKNITSSDLAGMKVGFDTPGDFEIFKERYKNLYNFGDKLVNQSKGEVGEQQVSQLLNDFKGFMGKYGMQFRSLSRIDTTKVLGKYVSEKNINGMQTPVGKMIENGLTATGGVIQKINKFCMDNLTYSKVSDFYKKHPAAWGVTGAAVLYLGHNALSSKMDVQEEY